MNALISRLEQARQAWNGGDLDAYLTLYHSSIRLHGYTPEPMDKASVAGFYKMIWASLTPAGQPSPQLAFFEMLTDGRLLSCRFAMTGVQTGPFMGFPATGKPFVLNGITHLRYGADDTVVERHSCADMLGLLVQIGAVPPPAA